LRKAIQKYGIKHAISFHRSIKRACDFSELNQRLNTGKLDNIILDSDHISSKKSAGERARVMDDFINESPALMTNARCLTEGVNVPAIDCVLFADPKQSIIDIVQASGRALRTFPGKEFGYIMLPLIVYITWSDNDVHDLSVRTFFDVEDNVIDGTISMNGKIYLVEELINFFRVNSPEDSFVFSSRTKCFILLSFEFSGRNGRRCPLMISL
jgi:predicted helicase